MFVLDTTKKEKHFVHLQMDFMGMPYKTVKTTVPKRFLKRVNNLTLFYNDTMGHTITGLCILKLHGIKGIKAYRLNVELTYTILE